MNGAFTIRRGNVGDAAVLARHRAEMFRDMGTLTDALYPELVDATRAWMERGIPAGEYVAWLALPMGAGLPPRISRWKRLWVDSPMAL